jgi:hypothetical protein
MIEQQKLTSEDRKDALDLDGKPKIGRRQVAMNPPLLWLLAFAFRRRCTAGGNGSPRYPLTTMTGSVRAKFNSWSPGRLWWRRLSRAHDLGDRWSETKIGCHAATRV